MNYNSILNNYISYLLYERGSSDLTVKAYKSDIKEFISFLSLKWDIDKFSFDNIDKKTGREFLANLTLEKKYKETTIRRKMYAISSFFNYLESEEIIKQNPFLKLKIPNKKKKSIPIFLSSMELDKLIFTTEKYSSKYGDLRDLICISILRYTGCRRNELLNLKWDDVNTDVGSIKFLGKGNKERLVPLHPYLQNYLVQYKENFFNKKSNWVIKGQNQEKLSNSALRKILIKYLKLAGLNQKNITPHKIRHSFASELLNNGVDIRIIQQWLGHENISTTAIYTHVTFEQLSDVWED